MRENQGISGRLTLHAHDSSGGLLWTREVQNHITNGGRNLVARLFAGIAVGTPLLKVVVGSGGAGVEATDADTRLVQLVDTVPVQPENIKVEGGLVTLSAVLPERAIAQALVEAGIVVDVGAEAEVLYNRVVFPVVNKTPNMQLTLVWKIDFGSGK